VLEMHGKEKLSWTHLTEHIFRDSIPAEALEFQQLKNTDVFMGNRIVFHVLSAEGDLKDIKTTDDGESLDEIADFLDDFDNNEVTYTALLMSGLWYIA